MLRQFLKELEARLPLGKILPSFETLFEKDTNNQIRFCDKAFVSLLTFLGKDEVSLRQVAVQAGTRWSGSAQKVALRNTIAQTGFSTPSCLWAFRKLRGQPEILFKDLPSPEMSLMQIILLREVDPTRAIPFLIQHFLKRSDVPDELRTASSLCIRDIVDSGISCEHAGLLQSRYPGMEDLFVWNPRLSSVALGAEAHSKDSLRNFHQLVRSVRDMNELSSLARTVYLVSLYYVPLTMREWRSLLLNRTDQSFFHKLRPTGLLESFGDGLVLSSEQSKQRMVKKFLYDKYSVARESVQRYRQETLRQERQRRVKTKELDRQALESLPDGVICVDRGGSLYYINSAAESMLNENGLLRERLFGHVSLEDALRRYSKEGVLNKIALTIDENGHATQVYGDRVTMKIGPKRYDVELGAQIILIRDTTDQDLINQEIGRLYRHELKAALDIMGVGIESARQLFMKSRYAEGFEFLDQVAQKKSDLCSMLEERIDFIRLHSDAFRISPGDVNFNLVVERCINNYYESAAAKRVSIASDHLEQPVVVIRGEEKYLIRALDNILRNAVKFCYPDSQITVSLSSDSFDGFVSVEDVGPGIAQENLDKIFRLGFTTGGTGRGLYLAQRIATAHGGRIEVKSELGKGSRFVLYIPLRMDK